MSHEVESMAFAHAVPWHGLGVRVSPDSTPEQIGTAAGLDWTVSKRPLFTTAIPPSTEEEPGRAGGVTLGDVKVPSRFALTRDSDNRVFDVVGKNWKPVQNSTVLTFFKRFCEDGGATMETAGSLRGGQIVWALANLGNGFVLPGGDAVKGYLLLASRHEAGYATIARVTPVRVVCANTLAMAGGFGSTGRNEVRVHHTSEFDPIRAGEAVGIARQGMTEFETNAKLLQRLNISRSDALRLLTPIYQPEIETVDVMKDPDKASRTVKAIMESALTGAGADLDVRGTGWGLLNGATYYANHKARGSADSRFSSTLLGSNNEAMNKLYRGLVELAT